MVGAAGFTADYALIVTWERMAYGGAPKSTRLDLFNQVKKWQNTYQMVLATDEIRTFSMFNYANINWTSSTSSGSLAGRGGVQSGVVGFNGGNGTGFKEMPYSAIGDSYKLYQYGSTPTAGRWQARIDESVKYGGCTNASAGKMLMEQTNNDMIGGFNINVSGPCFQKGQGIRVQYEELTIDCKMMNMAKAKCTIPPFSIYTYGPTGGSISNDGGRTYNFRGSFFQVPLMLSRPRVTLLDDPVKSENAWIGLDPTELSMKWNSFNLSTKGKAAMVDIVMFGYWENLKTHSLEEIGVIAKNIPNTGRYTFDPRQVSKQDRAPDAFKKYRFGLVNVRVSGNWMEDNGIGSYFSNVLVPFGWYFKDQYERHYGSAWALEMCKEWFEEDGKLYRYWTEVEEKYSCPCTLSQVMADRGRFMPEFDCDFWGDNFCPYNSGTVGCWISVYAGLRYCRSSFSYLEGGGQRCCYDDGGWLMFSHDFERKTDYNRFYSGGMPMRAHVLGHPTKKRPPFLVAFSNFFRDKYPMNLCCNWANHCEFFFWRRESSGCQNYRPGNAAFAYGCGHFQTFDNVKYTFPGKGVYVLSRLVDDQHDLMVQVLMEQPPKTDWNTAVGATVITGVSATSNGSVLVEMHAREEFRRWRYKMDVYAGGQRLIMDRKWKRRYFIGDATIIIPAYNLNMSQIWVYFKSGVGMQVTENHGVLDVELWIPPGYNQRELRAVRTGEEFRNFYVGNQFVKSEAQIADDRRNCKENMGGLLGNWDGDPADDLTTPDCNVVSPPPQDKDHSESDMQRTYQYGLTWKATGEPFRMKMKKGPIYNPVLYGSKDYRPDFNPWKRPLGHGSLSLDRNAIATQCAGQQFCEYDYLVTGRREIAMTTMRVEIVNDGTKSAATEKLISCGPLEKAEGVIKIPMGNNYLEGVTVRFICQPEYFLHGSAYRTCGNGTWNPAWWAWCRKRDVEKGLTALAVICAVLLFFAAIGLPLIWCFYMNVKGKRRYHQKQHAVTQRPQKFYASPNDDAKYLDQDNDRAGVTSQAAVRQMTESPGTKRRSQLNGYIADIPEPEPPKYTEADPDLADGGFNRFEIPAILKRSSGSADASEFMPNQESLPVTDQSFTIGGAGDTSGTTGPTTPNVIRELTKSPGVRRHRLSNLDNDALEHSV